MSSNFAWKKRTATHLARTLAGHNGNDVTGGTLGLFGSERLLRLLAEGEHPVEEVGGDGVADAYPGQSAARGDVALGKEQHQDQLWELEEQRQTQHGHVQKRVALGAETPRRPWVEKSMVRKKTRFCKNYVLNVLNRLAKLCRKLEISIWIHKHKNLKHI